MNKILITDVLTGLGTLPDGIAQTCVTSPPYYGLRNYGVEPTYWPAVTYIPQAGLPPVTIPAQTCCLGLESDPLAFIGHLVLVFREMHRVLRKDGTLWVNLGDSYSTGSMNPQGNVRSRANRDNDRTGAAHRAIPTGLKPKDLMGIPWRFAFAMQADGWYLRQDIIWNKPNPMPESVTDRCTKAHEYIFLLSKSQKYYFDADAIKMPLAESSIGRAGRKQDLMDRTGMGTIGKQVQNGIDRTHAYAGLAAGRNGKTGYDLENGLANRRSVWEIATKPYAGAHFAVFPEELPRLCILAGSYFKDVVIDPFMGSGTTAAVAVHLDRQFIGIDQDARNMPQQRQRLNDAGMMFCEPQPTWEVVEQPEQAASEQPATSGKETASVPPVLTGIDDSPVETGDTQLLPL